MGGTGKESNHSKNGSILHWRNRTKESIFQAEFFITKTMKNLKLVVYVVSAGSDDSIEHSPITVFGSLKAAKKSYWRCKFRRWSYDTWISDNNGDLVFIERFPVEIEYFKKYKRGEL